MKYNSAPPITSLPFMSDNVTIQSNQISIPKTIQSNVLQNYTFKTPEKSISTDKDVENFLHSDGFDKIMNFIHVVNESLINGDDFGTNCYGGSRKIPKKEEEIHLSSFKDYQKWKDEKELESMESKKEYETEKEIRKKRELNAKRMGMDVQIIEERKIKEMEALKQGISKEDFARMEKDEKHWIIKPPNFKSLVYVSPIIDQLLKLLDYIDNVTDNVPPTIDEAQRFGNRAFRDWISRLKSIIKPNFENLFKPWEILQNAFVELEDYLMDSFGNSIRIDYGSGHELSFIAFLTILYNLNVFTQHDLPAIALVIMPKYLEICRRIQITYRMEPAGSHGVWGLDDFQFIPYIWGSGQLVGQEVIKPKQTTQIDFVETHKDEYLWFGCIAYINQIKKGPFFEHSPMLNDISAVPGWSKVNRGLFKMYVGEVLSKRPIVQHLLFGSVLTMNPKNV